MKTRKDVEYQIQILTQLYSNLAKNGLNKNNDVYASSLNGAIRYLKWVIGQWEV